MTIAGIAVGVLLLIAVTVALVWARPVGNFLPLLLKLGRGHRGWWVLAVATAGPLWVGVGVGLSTPESHPFAWLLVLGVGVPLLLACAWAWARARSFS
jgi:hypothetical protein